MTQTDEVFRKRTNRIPCYMNDEEVAALDTLIRDYNKKIKGKPLSGPDMDRSSMLRFLIVEAAKRLTKH